VHVHLVQRGGTDDRHDSLPCAVKQASEVVTLALQVLECTWDNGVCEAWKAKNNEIMQRRALPQTEGDCPVIVLD
jgi:hypothetical protein